MIELTIINYDGTEKVIKGNPEGSLMNFMIENGVNVNSACRAGACGVCMANVIDGSEYLVQNKLSESVLELENGEFLTCIGGVDPKLILEDGTYKIKIKLID